MSACAAGMTDILQEKRIWLKVERRFISEEDRMLGIPRFKNDGVL